MRCAGDIHRAVTSHFKTPEPLRDPAMEIIEFQMFGTDLTSDGWTTQPDPSTWSSILTPYKSGTGTS